MDLREKPEVLSAHQIRNGGAHIEEVDDSADLRRHSLTARVKEVEDDDV